MKHRINQNGGGFGGLSRRDFLRLTGAGALGLGLAGRYASALAAAPATAAKGGHATTLIELVLWGGMTQFETFDPKPNAAPEYRSAFKPIPTNVPGIEICELLPKLAKMADKYDIIRTLMNPRTGHGDANYVMLANAAYPGDVISTHPSGKLVYPAVGAVVGMKKRLDGSYKGEIPAWVCCGRPPSGIEEGFLGSQYKPFIGTARTVQPAAKEAEQKRLADRRTMLDAIEPAAPGAGDAPAHEVRDLREDVFKSMTGEAQRVFDLSGETDEMKDRYGRNEFGQACLLARRLAEYGVPSISVPWGSIKTADGKSYSWDMHTELNNSVKALCPVLDQSLSTLITDLESRGLLEKTVVVLFAENGKAPEFSKEDAGSGRPNGTKSGRNHWGRGFSVVLSGGGFKGGRVVGEMDDNGELLKSRPVYPWDMWESIYQRLGIDPHDRLPHPSGCVSYVSMADACGLPRGGLLTELL